MSATGRLREGQTFGRYRIVRLIGEGGMGAVYEAIHPGLKRRFAVKTLLPEIAEREEVRVRFLREGEAAASISHPNVVVVSDVGTEDGVPYLVMEFLEGQNLAELLAVRGVLGVEESLALLLPVISAVGTGHRHGVIHRDLKPENIFLARGPWGDKIPKVLDFGVSKLTTDDNQALTKTTSVLGTAAYMSPEQARGAKLVGFASDQYSLGLILYEMLTGQRAYSGENRLEILYKVTSGVARPARSLKPDLSVEVDAMLGRMLAIDPADRYRSLQDCGRALLAFADAKTQMAMANAFPEAGPDAGVLATAIMETGGEAERANDGRVPLPASRGGGTLALPEQRDLKAVNTTLGQTAGEKSGVAGKSSSSTRPKRRVSLMWGAGAIAVVGGIVALGSKLVSEPSKAPSIAEIKVESPSTAVPQRTTPSALFEIRVQPPEAEIALDDRPPARGRLELILPLAGSSHHIRVSAVGYSPKDFSFGPDERPPADIRLDPAAVAAPIQAARAQDDLRPDTKVESKKPAKTESKPSKKAATAASARSAPASGVLPDKGAVASGPTPAMPTLNATSPPAQPRAETGGPTNGTAHGDAARLQRGSNNAPILPK